MKRRFSFKPAPTTSAMAFIIGVFMLISALVFISLADAPPGIIATLVIVWVLGVIVIVAHHVIIYHVVITVRPRQVVIQSEGPARSAKTLAEHLKDLEGLRLRKLISDADYNCKRQEILRQR